MPTHLPKSDHAAAIAALDRVIAAATAERARLLGEDDLAKPSVEPEPAADDDNEPELVAVHVAVNRIRRATGRDVPADSLRRAVRDGRIGKSEPARSRRRVRVDMAAALEWAEALPDD
jgi:hypothetical protein